MMHIFVRSVQGALRACEDNVMLPKVRKQHCAEGSSLGVSSTQSGSSLMVLIGNSQSKLGFLYLVASTKWPDS